MLIDNKLANVFLSKYKTVLSSINSGIQPDTNNEYVYLRSQAFDNINKIEKNAINAVGHEFIESIKSGIYGKFVYLKKYQNGYILQNIETGKYYQVAALTTPLEELTSEYSIIETAIIPFANQLICDGLIIHQGIHIGKNMQKEIRNGYWQAKRSGELIINA